MKLGQEEGTSHEIQGAVSELDHRTKCDSDNDDYNPLSIVDISQAQATHSVIFYRGKVGSKQARQADTAGWQ